MSPPAESNKWAGRPTLDPLHHRLLDASAAIHEFKHKMPRHEAEQKAYDDYLKQHAIDSGAHHFLGMKIAHAAGNDYAAKQHFDAYSKAVKHLGADPNATPPREITERLKASKPELYNFKAHASDAAIPAAPEKTSIEGYLDRIHELRTQLASKK